MRVQLQSLLGKTLVHKVHRACVAPGRGHSQTKGPSWTNILSTLLRPVGPIENYDPFLPFLLAL
jgi:hypothetical protein